MRYSLIFVLLLMSSLFLSSEAKADIEALQAVITTVGDVVEGAKEQITKAKSFIESAQQLETQAKKFAKDAQNTVNQAKDAINQTKKAVKTAQQKADEIKSRVDDAVNKVKETDLGDLKSNLSSVEFASLNEVLDGTKPDDEAAEAVLDNLVRKKGNDSIENQRALTKAINRKSGQDMSNMYGRVLVLRQKIKNEKDDFQNPQSIDEAIELSQKAQMSSMKRRRDVLNMEANVSRFNHMRLIQNVEGSYGEENE